MCIESVIQLKALEDEVDAKNQQIAMLQEILTLGQE